jgi:hypothetical protein
MEDKIKAALGAYIASILALYGIASRNAALEPVMDGMRSAVGVGVYGIPLMLAGAALIFLKAALGVNPLGAYPRRVALAAILPMAAVVALTGNAGVAHAALALCGLWIAMEAIGACSGRIAEALHGAMEGEEEEEPEKHGKGTGEHGEAEKAGWLEASFPIPKEPNYWKESAQANRPRIAPPGCEPLQRALDSLGVRATAVEAIDAPALTKYLVRLDSGERAKAVEGAMQDIQLALRKGNMTFSIDNGHVVLEAPKPAAKRQAVHFRELMGNAGFMAGKQAVPLGRDASGKDFLVPLESLPHLLVGGKSGSGKTAFLRALILSLAARNSPAELGLMVIDGGMTEFEEFEDLPHLLAERLTEPAEILRGLQWAREELMRRQKGNLKDAPKLVVVVDEAGTVVSGGKREIEPLLAAIGRLGRKFGVHLVLADQRPDRKIIAGVVQANFSKVCLKVENKTESEFVIDAPGGEKLTGKGDLLCRVDGELKRLQGYYVTEGEAYKATQRLAARHEPLERLRMGAEDAHPFSLRAGADDAMRCDADDSGDSRVILLRDGMGCDAGDAIRCDAGGGESEKVIEMFNAGKSFQKIADALEISKSKVQRIIQKYKRGMVDWEERLSQRS